MRRKRKRRCWFAATVCLSAIMCQRSLAQEEEEPRKLIVATREAPPFAIRDDQGLWTGISIDLWREIAKELNLDYEFRELSLDEMLASLEDGSSDAAVAALTITNQREQDFDFTHAFYTSGLGIAVAAEEPSGGFVTVFRAIFSRAFLEILAGLLLVLIVMGVLIWLFERRRNPEEFGGSASRGLGSGFWWSAVTMTTVGYGDKSPVTLWGRLLAIIWMFASLFMISVFTGSVASLVLADQLNSNITGLKDLPQAKVGVVADSTSEAYLRRQRIGSRAYETVRVALKALQAGQLDAVVYDAPILRYTIDQEFRDDLAVLPIRFETQNYGIGLPAGSKLREPVNQSLLRITGEEDWANTLYRYFGE